MNSESNDKSPLKKKASQVSNFAKLLFEEINDELASFFKKHGLLKIIIITVLAYLFYHFYPKSIPSAFVAIVLILGLIKIKLGEKSKISGIIIILGGLVFGLVILAGIWEIIAKPIINWFE